VHLPAGATFPPAVKDGYNAFAYVYEGALEGIPERSAAVFTIRRRRRGESRKDGARFILASRQADRRTRGAITVPS